MAAVQRCRDYRIDLTSKKLQLLRGEFHRHTEISWDGGPDGSLEDMFRYAIDAASMDWIGNGDHDSGAGREYSWWLIQKFTDAYHVKNQFTPMFTYERSVAYPHGHRNCMFAKRGVRTLPRLAEADPQKRVGGFTPTTPKCCTATSASWTASAPFTPAPLAWAPTGATTIRSSSRSSRFTRATACPTSTRMPHGPAMTQDRQGAGEHRRLVPQGLH